MITGCRRRPANAGSAGLYLAYFPNERGYHPCVGEVALPYIFVALIAIEYVWNAWRRTGYQTPRDSAVSLMVTIPHAAVLSFLPVAWIVAYRAVEGFVPWQMPAAWWTWPLGIVVIDFATYWMHRYHHALNLTWGVHSVHHSSDELTITTGGRASFLEPLVNVLSGAYVLLVLPALIGLPLPAAALGWLVKDTWGFAVHTRNIRTLGVLEYFMATPSHHRVHHAINPIYRGKNFGFVSIIWDKLFGTFQPERADVAPIYGTLNPPRSFQPLAVSLHELATIWRDARATRRVRDKLRIWYMPAGWRPSDLPPHPERAHERYAPPAPRNLYIVGGLSFAYVIVAMAHLGATLHHHGTALDALYLAFVIGCTIIVGEFFERSPRYRFAESIRAAITIVLIASGSWFGRPLDAWVVVLAVLGATSLGAAWISDERIQREAPRVGVDLS